MKIKELYNLASYQIKNSDGILILLGSNFLSDSLKQIKTTKQLYDYYPKLENISITYNDLTKDKFFDQFRQEAYEFYSNEINLYKRKENYEAYELLNGIITSTASYHKNNFLIITENYDGLVASQNYKSNKIIEVNGSINSWQCSKCNSYQDYLKIINKKSLSCSYCKGHLKPTIKVNKDDTSINLNHDKFEKYYFKFLSDNLNKKLVIFELGVDYPIYPQNSFGQIKDICNNLMTEESIKANIIRVNPYKTSRVKQALRYFLGDDFHYEKLVNIDNFDIDEYLLNLKKEDIKNLTDFLGLQSNISDGLYTRTINSLSLLREYEIKEIKTASNMVIDVNESIKTFLSNVNTRLKDNVEMINNH